MKRVLSLFDGISCARVAIDRLGIDCTYYASEIDKYAIEIAKKNYPDTIHLGDVKSITADMFDEPIDLLIGGSPCQDLSIAKANRNGLDGERSGLFWEYVRIWKELKPKYFVLENVNSMPKEAKRVITETMGVEPIMINASLVSAQNRKRLFWTNIPGVTLPEDRKIVVNDILQDGIIEFENEKWVQWLMSDSGQKRIKMWMLAINPDKGLPLMARGYASWSSNYITVPLKMFHLNSGGQGDRVYSPSGKSTSLSANDGMVVGAKTGLYCLAHGYNKGGVKYVEKYPTLHSQDPSSNHRIICKEIGERYYLIRKLTPVECERLQSLDDGYTYGVSNTQRYKCLGNAFNVEVIRHILSFHDLVNLQNKEG